MRRFETRYRTAPSDIAWSWLPDVARWREWTPTTGAVGVLDHGKASVGMRVRLHPDDQPEQ
ncbi:hypothetical protein [Luteimonas notoginsengisoli]|uniref:Polyketide cyclase n=1 Tax=Luteimonas notoginsengisoli TaxID=1578200 RepID=A0ABV7UQA5_9GAMM